MGDVEAHVRTFAGVFTGSKALSQQLKEYYTFDRWITYNMREECTVATCQYSRVHKVMSHALILPEFITTTNGSTKREFSIAHGVIRALLQSSGVRQQCPTCKDYRSILRTKQVNTISLPRRLVVGLDSAGNLCLEDPPDVLNICTGREYHLVGVAMRTSGHYRCNVRVGDAWFHYDDGGGIPTPKMHQVNSPSYKPFNIYRRRLLYYGLTEHAPNNTPPLAVPQWMPTHGAPEGENEQEEVLD